MSKEYAIIKPLGSGTFGKCFLVTHLPTHEVCVLKQIDLSPMTRDKQLATLREASIMERLQHPYVIKFREVFKTKKNRLCIVMEYADGGDLGQRLAEGGAMGEEESLRIFVQVCMAIQYMHDQRILHRDLKPQNVFLTSSSLVKLGDFGVSKQLPDSHDFAMSLVGTPLSLSPEIVLGREYSFQSDIWALGVMLYQMCTGKNPFDARSVSDLLNQITSGNVKPLPAHISADTQALVASMMQKDPATRPNIHQVLDTPLLKRHMLILLSQTMHRSHPLPYSQAPASPDSNRRFWDQYDPGALQESARIALKQDIGRQRQELPAKAESQAEICQLQYALLRLNTDAEEVQVRGEESSLEERDDFVHNSGSYIDQRMQRRHSLDMLAGLRLEVEDVLGTVVFTEMHNRVRRATDNGSDGRDMREVLKDIITAEAQERFLPMVMRVVEMERELGVYIEA